MQSAQHGPSVMDDRRFAAIGLLLNSALYLSGCFVAGLFTGNSWAWKFALASFGLAYVGYVLQLIPASRRSAWFPVVLSIGTGVLSGLFLLIAGR